MTSLEEPKEVVLAFVNAINAENFDEARRWVTDDLSFIGVMGTRNGADVYFQDMQRMKFKYDIKKSFADGQDVCLWYDINMAGKTIFSSGWYHVKDSKIDWFKVIFDPRPLLEDSK